MSQLSGYDVLPGEAWEEEDGAALETARQTSLHRRMYPQDGNLNDAAIAGVIGVVLTGLFAMATPAVLHWFLLPVWICGMLIGKDGVAWVRGKMDIFDVKGMVGIVGYHFFFLSPVLWIFYEGQPKEMPIPEDWRT
jgi:ABC-type polysaccharide/polyol phosphate export permease